MKSITFFILIAIFSSTMNYSYSKPPYQNYENLADEITVKIAKKLKNEKDLTLIGIGGGMMDDIKMMMMSFEYCKAVDLETTRHLLVYCVEEYLSAINASKELRPFLHNYPFTNKNIEIELIFRNPDRSDVAKDKINVASANEGKLCYYIDNPETFSLKAIHKETFEEALETLSSNK